MRRVTGFREWLPEEAARRRDMESELCRILREAGYGEVRVPLLESAGPGSDYRLLGANGEMVALRSDFTRSVVGLALRSLSRSRPLRLFYSGPVFRPVGPGGESSELWQVGAEILGAVTGGDAEVLRLAIEGVARVAPPGRIRAVIGHAGLTEKALERAGLTGNDRELAGHLLRSGDMVGMESLLEDKVTAHQGVRSLMELLLFAGSSEETARRWEDCGGSCEELQEILALGRNIPATSSYSLGLSPGLSYYTGAVFKVYAGDDPGCLAHGGRYDDLASRLGQDEPATGFVWNLDNLLEISTAIRSRVTFAGIH